MYWYLKKKKLTKITHSFHFVPGGQEGRGGCKNIYFAQKPSGGGDGGDINGDSDDGGGDNDNGGRGGGG